MVAAAELFVQSGAPPGCSLPVLLRPMPAGPSLISVLLAQVPVAPLKARATAWELPDPPEWAQAPPEPWGAVKKIWKALSDGVNDGADKALLLACIFGTWYALTYRSWIPAAVVTALWLGSLAYGLSTLWLCLASMSPARWTVRRAGVATGLLTLVGALWLSNGALLWVMLLSLGAAQLFAARPVQLEAPNWWSDQRLKRNWIDADLISDKLEDLWFRRIVPFHEDEHGMQTLTVVPMAGPRKDARVINIGVDRVDKARAALERVMGLKVGQLHVSHDDDHDAGAITLTVTPPARKDIVLAELPAQWNYDDDLPVGRDKRSRPHSRPTWGRHAMFVGATGSGKTWAGRYEIAHAVLDERISFYLIDGKGDAVDWEPLHPLCTRYVLGASKAAAEKAYAILQEIEQVSDSRSGLLGDADGIVVVVDEWYRLIGAAGRYDKKLAGNMAALFSELLATARSRRIRFLTFWQRGTDSYIDTDMRGNMVQRFVGVTGDKADARYPLDAVPDELPKAPGQFNYKDSGSRPVLVTMPALDRDAFAEACRRGLELRRATPVESPVVSDLEAAVLSLLEVDEPQKASQLLSMLPTELRPAGKDEAAQAQRLGYALMKMASVEATTVRGQKHYRRSPVAAPSQPRTAASNPASTGVAGSDPSTNKAASAETGVSP